MSRDSDTSLLPHVATLEGFVHSSRDGIDVYAAAPMTTLRVRTRNTSYRIVVTRDRHVCVEGGRFFPAPTTACLEGCSAGGSLLRIGWIAVGLCMEFTSAGRRIVTSPVRTVEREETPAGRTH